MPDTLAPQPLNEATLSAILSRFTSPASYTDPQAAQDVEALLAERHYWMNRLLASQHSELQLRLAVAEQLRGLLDDLENEWLRNHDDSCSNTHKCASFGGATNCYYPRPASFAAAKALGIEL